MIRGMNKGEEVFSDNFRIVIPGKNGKCRVGIQDISVPDNQDAGWRFFGELAVFHQHNAPGRVSSSTVLPVWCTVFW